MAIDPTPVRDVVVVVPGIMGSELVDADGRALWSVRPGALAHAIRTLGRSLGRLTLPDGIGDEGADDGVRATALLDSLHVVPGVWSPITGYDGLLRFLGGARFLFMEPRRADPDVVPNLVPFPYDWRLSNRYNGRLLARLAFDVLARWRAQPGMEAAKLVLICHSMGGLVARWFAEREGGAEVIRALVTIGTPYRGALKALTTLVNGLEPGIGPLRVPLTGFARSLPALYQLLPTYDCLATAAGRAGLATARCPGLDEARVRDALAFHEAIAGREDSPYTLHKVVGIRQPTPTTAEVAADRVVASTEIDGRDQGGDGTVPRLAAEPVVGRGREVHEVADQHGELQGTRSLLDLVDGLLAREEIVWEAAPIAVDGVGVEMADLWSTREAPRLRVTGAGDRRLLVTLEDETGRTVTGPVPLAPDGTADLGRLPEGGYRAIVASRRRGGPPPVTKPFVVLDPDGEVGPTCARGDSSRSRTATTPRSRRSCGRSPTRRRSPRCSGAGTSSSRSCSRACRGARCSTRWTSTSATPRRATTRCSCSGSGTGSSATTTRSACSGTPGRATWSWPARRSSASGRRGPARGRRWSCSTPATRAAGSSTRRAWRRR
jgi:pimeloyl-ACP methyl ester carboxylesterase